MKSKPPFIPPKPLDGIDINPSGLSDIESIESSPVYEKYARKYDPKSPENIKKAKAIQAERRKLWWSQNWIAFFSLIIAVMALVAALLK